MPLLQAAVLGMKLQLQPDLNMEEVSWVVVTAVNVAVLAAESSKCTLFVCDRLETSGSQLLECQAHIFQFVI